jgi:uncharacterized protein DUF4157
MRSRQYGAEAAPKSGTAVDRVAQPRGPVRHGDELLRIQRQYGNRYVQRLLEGRSAVGFGPRGRERLELAFGMDLSSVTVEHDPRVAAMDALAYTQGERISVAPGQRLDTAAGQRLT